MNKPQRGLGKGLSALLGESMDIPGAIPSRAARTEIQLSSISPNPRQPRSSFDDEALEELASSIRSIGIIQPITVRKVSDGKYQIISGERRYRASIAAGLDTIPAYIREADDTEMLEMAIVENVQRTDLDPIETAMGYRRLIEECGLTHEQLSERVGKKRASVTNFLRLLKLSPNVQQALRDGAISTGHAKVILGFEDETLQDALCEAAVKGGLSVRQLEEKVRHMQESGTDAAEPEPLPENYSRVIDHFGKFFGKGVSVHRSPSGKGTITIRFSSDDQVEKFLDSLKG